MTLCNYNLNPDIAGDHWKAGVAVARIGRLVALAAVLAAAPILIPSAFAGDSVLALTASGLAGGNRALSVSVPLNQSRVVHLESPVARVSVANPEVADILVLNPKELYVVGKNLGSTNVVIWDRAKRVQQIIGVDVTHDLENLKRKLYQYLPGEKIGVESAQESIVLSGEVSSAQKMDAAMNIARTFVVGKKNDDEQKKALKVLNLMQVGGAQQVMLEVTVAEIARTLTRRLDIDFNLFRAGDPWRIGAVNGGAAFPDAVLKDAALGLDNVRVPVFDTFPPGGTGGTWGPALPEIGFNENGIADTGTFMQYLSGDFLFEMIVDAAKNQGLAKVLAEPNLTTLSGQQAKFISGGEFPIPVPTGLGAIGIEFKEYGVGVIFVPVVLDSGLISLKVNVTVSELEFDNSVQVGFLEGTSSASFFVPALSKRAANATVEVPSGKTIAIAGLINENLRESLDKFPGLGDLPVLGPLFRSQEFVKGETELVIFVTPRLAKPFDPKLVKLPTDDFVEPSETEFYLMGRIEGVPRGGVLGPDRDGVEGRFGHEL